MKTKVDIFLLKELISSQKKTMKNEMEKNYGILNFMHL